MIHETISINPVPPNFTNSKPSNMQQEEIKAKGGTTGVFSLSLAGSLLSVCAGFVTFAVSVQGCFFLSFLIYFHFGISRPRESRYKFVSVLRVQ